MTDVQIANTRNQPVVLDLGSRVLTLRPFGTAKVTEAECQTPQARALQRRRMIVVRRPREAVATGVAGVDINRATAEELTALPGVGPALAKRIVAFRLRHGPFTSVEELAEVRGIGKAGVKKIVDHEAG